MQDCGGPWLPEEGDGGGGGGLPPKVMAEIKRMSEKGIVISGVITWKEAQMDTHGSNIWKSLAERCFADSEVTAAKEALKDAKGHILETLVPDFKKKRQQGVNKKTLELDDITKAISALQQAGEMPLVLATICQMTKCPQSWGVPQAPTNQDVIGKIAMLEKSISDSAELQKEYMREVKEEIATIRAGAGPPKSPRIPVINLTPETPNSKKRKLNQAQADDIQNQQPSYASMAGIQPFQQQHGLGLLQTILQNKQQQSPRQPRNICYGSGKTGQEGEVNAQLAADVNRVASGVAKDCTEDNLRNFLMERGVPVVEVQQLTRQEVLAEVRTLTFRVSIKAAGYEAALKPEVWPYRVGVRYYKPPKRTDRQDSGWQGQSGRTGGQVDTQQGGVSVGGLGGALGGGRVSRNVGGNGSGLGGQLGTGAGGVQSGGHTSQNLPPGHPGRVNNNQQLMGHRLLGPVEVSNLYSVLASLGNGMGGVSNQQ